VFVAVRALVYAVLFISLVLVALPRWVLRTTDNALNEPSVASSVLGALVFFAGAALVVACVVSFVVRGKGTPAPFDPPRRLVMRGPYAYVRNPMYIGAVTVMIGAAIYYRSVALALFALAFAAVMHLFVVLYEEPVLTRTFGDEYAAYRERVGRWLPSL
jgi:protein-S-isoprenylcysteine O-methyltransferase Ste14